MLCLVVSWRADGRMPDEDAAAGAARGVAAAGAVRGAVWEEVARAFAAGAGSLDGPATAAAGAAAAGTFPPSVGT